MSDQRPRIYLSTRRRRRCRAGRSAETFMLVLLAIGGLLAAGLFVFFMLN